MPPVKILVSTNPDILAEAMANKPSVTVEAEYGARVVEGTLLTLAHHVPAYQHFPSPCTRKNLPVEHLEVIGLSHIDLDSVGGALSVLGIKPENYGFWELAGFVDVNGPHKIKQSKASEGDIERLYAYWAYTSQHRVEVPKDGSLLDVTDEVIQHGKALEAIMEGNRNMMFAGKEYMRAQKNLSVNSYVQREGDVIIRVASAFTNGLYDDPIVGDVAKAMASYNPKHGAVTISLADPIEGVSCRDIVQKLWGELAGGHVGIAGSPRDQRMNITDLLNAAHALKAAIYRSTKV